MLFTYLPFAWRNGILLTSPTDKRKSPTRDNAGVTVSISKSTNCYVLPQFLASTESFLKLPYVLQLEKKFDDFIGTSKGKLTENMFKQT